MLKRRCDKQTHVFHFCSTFSEIKAACVILQDGQIAEVVQWEVGQSQRHCIPDRVVEYVLKRHMGADVSVTGQADLLDAVMVQKGTPPDELSMARRYTLIKLQKLNMF
jgi:hypothetical protein